MPSNAIWQIVYEVIPHALVSAKVEAIEDYGLSLEYDESGSLAFLIHKIEVPEDVEGSEALARSRRALGTLFEALSFSYGPSILFNATKVSSLGPAAKPADKVQQLLTVAADAVAVKAVTVPTAAQLAAAPKRFGAWLHFANLARNTPNDAEAVRTYYLVLEDIRKGVIDEEEERWLMYVRHFVSHGVQLDDEEVKGFIGSALGEATAKYNPMNQKHERLAKEWRARGRAIVDAELIKYL